MFADEESEFWEFSSGEPFNMIGPPYADEQAYARAEAELGGRSRVLPALGEKRSAVCRTTEPCGDMCSYIV